MTEFVAEPPEILPNVVNGGRAGGDLRGLVIPDPPRQDGPGGCGGSSGPEDGSGGGSGSSTRGGNKHPRGGPIRLRGSIARDLSGAIRASELVRPLSPALQARVGTPFIEIEQA
jgi:hypothetical protein